MRRKIAIAAALLIVVLGSELRQPLGCTIVGGLLLSQLLTLYTTPVVYIYLDRLRTWIPRQRRKAAAMLPSASAQAGSSIAATKGN